MSAGAQERRSGGSANALWCPLTFNHDVEAHCRGRHCAAWVFTADHAHRKLVHAADPKLATDDPPERPAHVPPTWTWLPYWCEDGEEEPAQWVQPWDEAEDDRLGRCGLVRL